MFTTFKTSQGDTFDSISRRVYGSEGESYRIKQVNPGVVEPLQVGVDLVIPQRPDALVVRQQHAMDSAEGDVVVLINNKRFRFWESINITRSIDSFDMVSLSAPMESDNAAFRAAFRPFSFDRLVAMVGGVPLFTGVVVNVTPNVTPNDKTVEVSAYALPGVLNDCTPPSSVYPAQEFNDQGLRDIARTVAGWYGLGVEFKVSQGPVFDTVACEVDRTALSFLIDLAKQRNLILSSTPLGKLLITKSVRAGSPVGALNQGESPVISITSQFRPQQYFSHITGVAPEAVDADGAKFTLRNFRLTGVVRPFTFIAGDTDSTNVQDAVKSKIGRMFGTVASYTVEVNTWYDPAGELWAPNTTVILTAPDAMIYKPYEFIIRAVSFNTDSTSRVATLSLALQGAFSGELPESLPWDE